MLIWVLVYWQKYSTSSINYDLFSLSEDLTFTVGSLLCVLCVVITFQNKVLHIHSSSVIFCSKITYHLRSCVHNHSMKSHFIAFFWAEVLKVILPLNCILCLLVVVISLICISSILKTQNLSKFAIFDSNGILKSLKNLKLILYSNNLHSFSYASKW